MMFDYKAAEAIREIGAELQPACGSNDKVYERLVAKYLEFKPRQPKYWVTYADEGELYYELQILDDEDIDDIIATVAKKCEEPYTAFLSMGIGMVIVMQALLHMYISVGNFVTGQPLPLMSQGGTSFLINSVYIGFLLCISRYANAANENTATPETIV